MKKNNLDERQELKLLQIEHNAMWFAFWGLVIAMVVQLIIDQDSIKMVIGEGLILILMSIYIVFACINNGIWDRKLKADHKTNFILSVLAGVVVAVINFIVSYIRYRSVANSLATVLFMFLFTVILCYIVLIVVSAMYKNKVKKLDENIEE